MDLAEDLRSGLQEILVRGAVELHENGSRTTPAWPLSWEVRGAPEKPLLHLWSENCSVTRRAWPTPTTPKTAWRSPSSASAA